MNKRIIAQLKRLHFSENEASVYVTLLMLGETSAGNIIKKTQLHRSVVYETLEKLITRSLVFKIQKNKITHYIATDVNKVLNDAQQQLDIAKKLVPHLGDLLTGNTAEINVYEGVRSYKDFWFQAFTQMPKNSIDYVAGSIGYKWVEAGLFTQVEMDELLEIRLKRKIKWQMIYFENPQEFELDYVKRNPSLHEYRLIINHFNAYGNFNILGTKSVILHSVNEPMVIEITNKTLVSVFQNIFNTLWEIAKPVK